MSFLNSLRQQITHLTGPFQWAQVPCENFTFGTYNPHGSALWKKVRRGEFEHDETAIVKELAPSCDLFIDVGAHIGYFSCLAHAVNPQIKNVAFEPNHANFKSLKKNFEVNTIGTTALFNIGLGRSREQLTLYGEDSAATFNTSSFKITPPKKQIIEIRPLNDFTDMFTDARSTFMKIDVEGFEYDLLLGARNFIQKIKPKYLLMEITRYSSGGENKHFIETLEILKNLGYSVYEITDREHPLTDFKVLQGGNYFFKLK